MFAKDRYYQLQQAYKRKDKVELMKFLSVPLYDVYTKYIYMRIDFQGPTQEWISFAFHFVWPN